MLHFLEIIGCFLKDRPVGVVVYNGKDETQMLYLKTVLGQSTNGYYLECDHYVVKYSLPPGVVYIHLIFLWQDSWTIILDTN